MFYLKLSNPFIPLNYSNSICDKTESRREVEKWYSVEKSSRRETPSIRLKCQFQSIDILPLRDYEHLTKFLKDEYKTLCKMLEPHISVKVKEELSSSMMNVFKIQDVAEDILADIVVHEISTNENESLTFRQSYPQDFWNGKVCLFLY